MRKSLVALMLVAGCGGAQPAANRSAAAPQGAPAGAAPGAAPAASSAGDGPASLTGLWEGGRADRPDQLCLIEKGGKTQFGIVTWGANLDSCSGAGLAERDGGRVTLRMTGDSACTIEAEAADGRIVLRRADGPGCRDYYCGHGARFDGAAFSRKGAGEAAARKATDIAGDPLCG
ncbi:MAG: hypothetical protein JOZ90_05700 [Alphaproteobacteria bacterium]|nr:hypothetical protein [Alphaproteobacteria bacterium]MBV9370670.1 hypothetical protein [Alphaproteobacteria bacterium]MBV9900575.1 hypothetical protein [Alphaproteobacteria bacterium]